MRNSRSFTIIEVLISSVIVVVLFACSISVFMTMKEIFRDKIAEYGLQQDANTMVARIIRSYKESGGIVGLRSAVSFTLPVVAPAGSKIQYVGTDGQTRSYFLSGNTIQYASPTQSPNQKAVYTAKPGSSIILRFWEPPGSGDHETVGIYLAVSQPVGNRTVSGSISTYVNLRNIPKS